MFLISFMFFCWNSRNPFHDEKGLALAAILLCWKPCQHLEHAKPLN
jgi:hypothetical protein